MKFLNLFILNFILFFNAYSQNSIPVIKASYNRASLRENNIIRKDSWRILPELKPDVWNVIVPKGSKKRVTFITDIDSISYLLKSDTSYNFLVLLNNTDSAYTRISTHPEAAIFNNDYIRLHNNKTIIEIPEVYELVNIIFSLTNIGLDDRRISNFETIYYKDFLKWFSLFKKEKIVLVFDSIIQKDFNKYYAITQDAYSYFIINGKITKSKTYERFNDGFVNAFTPYIKEIEDFYHASKFKNFYISHRDLYDAQIKYFKDSVNVPQMQKWLNKNFPTTKYNCFKLIFSQIASNPALGNYFENNNFKEAVIFANFTSPYKLDILNPSELNKLYNGNEVFIEFNYAFIISEARKFLKGDDYKLAFKDLNLWVDDSSISIFKYTNTFSCLIIYMSKALVSLRYIDIDSIDEANKWIKKNEKYQKEIHGLKKFPEFNKNLILLYKNRKTGETIADLFPSILKWCRESAEFH